MESDDLRRREILVAVLDILKRDGVAGLSTAALAAEARCSKSTLYALFGSRAGILKALISEQSRSVNEMLGRELASVGDPERTLVDAGAALLDLLTGDASAAINKAAMADATGELGQLLLEQGRGRTAPLFAQLIARLQAAGGIGAADAAFVFKSFYGLLVGDRQIRILLGDRGARPSGGEFRSIAAEAVARLKLLFPASTPTA
ncbi:TetR family transcriptional regulator [Mesorhizobium sp. L-8-10]|uniref:TetR/AcrR family transcriptional regulator n=1 Tax=unclassified Mesorhizobium TaxID=325217 RepID=UPI001925D9AF|nr:MULTISPECIES: TetR/AcrR family transcriptional regulator [unclassified Mesorhizobium]BCH24258.1 TetR family transcriptional regulator [Mesorhizobium sp. L-8-3]BCH31993.1 TetR family transcriptional regulator [Mesorhizobium sp. L-8-10]